MTPDVTRDCVLGSCDVRAMDGKLREASMLAQGMLDTLVAFGKSNSAEAKGWRSVLDTCNECRSIVAHAQRGGVGESAMPYREPKGRLDRL